MTYGKLTASAVRVSDFTVPPRNGGRYKEVASIADHGGNVTFTFTDATKMSVAKTDRIPVGSPVAWPPLN
jgi:hypothetical protein